MGETFLKTVNANKHRAPPVHVAATWPNAALNYASVPMVCQTVAYHLRAACVWQSPRRWPHRRHAWCLMTAASALRCGAIESTSRCHQGAHADGGCCYPPELRADCCALQSGGWMKRSTRVYHCCDHGAWTAGRCRCAARCYCAGYCCHGGCGDCGGCRGRGGSRCCYHHGCPDHRSDRRRCCQQTNRSCQRWNHTRCHHPPTRTSGCVAASLIVGCDGHGPWSWT